MNALHGMAKIPFRAKRGPRYGSADLLNREALSVFPRGRDFLMHLRGDLPANVPVIDAQTRREYHSRAELLPGRPICDRAVRGLFSTPKNRLERPPASQCGRRCIKLGRLGRHHILVFPRAFRVLC